MKFIIVILVVVMITCCQAAIQNVKYNAIPDKVYEIQTDINTTTKLTKVQRVCFCRLYFC